MQINRFFTDGMHCLGSCFILDVGLIVKFKCMKCGLAVYKVSG